MKVLIKTIARNFIFRPATNMINLFGLSISLIMVIILSTYSFSELTTDDFHENVDNVYLFRKNKDAIYAPGILTETIKGKIPGLESVVRVTSEWEATVFRVENKDPLISDLVFADEEFFNMFSYRSAEGDLYKALNEPMTLVISESLSEKLFGNEPAIGKPVIYNNGRIFTITGVFREQEKNTCIRFNAITSTESQKILQPGMGQFTKWGRNSFNTYLLLGNGQDTGRIIRNIVQSVPEDERKDYVRAGLTPLKKVYFSNFWVFDRTYLQFGNLKKTVTLLMVGGLILLIALVNFINISSSQWSERIRHFGVKKLLGANRILIIRAIITESFIYFLAALLLATQLSAALSPFVGRYTGISYSDKIIGSFGFHLLLLVGVAVLSLIVSIIPAVRIASSNALDNLRKSLVSSRSDNTSNGIMVTAQFAITIALISFTILVQKQVSFGTSTLGMNQDNIIGIKLTPQIQEKREVLKASLEKEASVDMISFTEYYPGEPVSNWAVEMTINGEKKLVSFNTFCADDRFYTLMGLRLSAGKLYSDTLKTEGDKAIVNESFLKKYNISDPLGLSLPNFDGSFMEIAGVISDFHHEPVNTEIVPLVIRNGDYYTYCMVHLHTNDFRTLDKSIREIKKTVSELSPSFPVEVSFMDAAIQNMYLSEVMFRHAFLLLAASALVLCCLGILAMSISACQKRVKEIGIRRVNGARASEILLMLNRDMIKWVMMAFLISSIIVWYFMHLWLRNYAYKTEISWWIFAVSGLTAFSIAFLTVSWQTWMAATRNPVEALRYE